MWVERISCRDGADLSLLRPRRTTRADFQVLAQHHLPEAPTSLRILTLQPDVDSLSGIKALLYAVLAGVFPHLTKSDFISLHLSLS